MNQYIATVFSVMMQGGERSVEHFKPTLSQAEQTFLALLQRSSTWIV